MPAIVKEITIAADPERVFNALTQQEEIVLCWSNEAQVKPEVGSLGEFRFRSPAGVLQFEVAELKAGEKVHWISRQGPAQWAGTSVTWELTPIQIGTKLIFTHDGFAQVDAVFEQSEILPGDGERYSRLSGVCLREWHGELDVRSVWG